MSWRKAWVVAIVLLMTAPSVAADPSAASWPQWRGPNRDDRSPDKGLLQSWETDKPQLEWSVNGLGAGYSSISIADGRIYTMGNVDGSQSVLALSAKNGELLWKKAITSGVPKHSYEGSRCTPSIDGDRLYVVASSGEIACLKAADGEIVWKRDFTKDWEGRMMSGWGFSESPLVDGPWVLCTPGAKDALIVALDKMTGKEVWKAAWPAGGGDEKPKRGGAGYSSIVISQAAGVKQYVQLTGDGVLGVRASDGKPLWGYSGVANRTANIPTPLVSGDFIFCSSGYQTGAALLKLSAEGDGVKATEVYFIRADRFQNHHGGMVLIGDHVYAGSGHNNGFPACIELATGNVVWGGARGPGEGSAAVTYADGHLVFRYQSGEVALIEATPTAYRLKGTFKPDFVQKPSWAHPVVIGGKLYLREQDKLMCYDVRAKGKT